MKLIESYVVGKLELIAQQRSKIIVRIVDCGNAVRVYGDKELEQEHSFGQVYGDFHKNEITLSHPLTVFKEGDKVKLSRIPGEHDENDKFSLENLTLSKSHACTLEEAFSTEGAPTVQGKELFSIEIHGVLERLQKGNGKVAFRLKSNEKTYVFFDNDTNQTNKTQVFDKTVYAEIPMEKLLYDVTLLSISYKEGDKVSLSGMVNEDFYNLDNTTLAIGYGNPNYKSRWDL